MTVTRTARRTLGMFALLAPVALLVTAPSALAASSDFTNPSSDGAVVSNTLITANVPGCTRTIGTCANTSLAISGPDSASASGSVKSQSNTQQISATLPATANGKWTATLSGGDTGSITFYTNNAPAVPSGFSADTESGDTHEVFLTWNKGTEPDLTGYNLYDGNGNELGSVTTSACQGSSCSDTLYYGNSAPGTYTYTYALTALRSGGGCSGCAATLESDKTGTKTASLTTAASPSPSPTASSGGSGSTGGSTSGSGGSTSGSGTTGSGTTGSGTTGSGTTGSGTTGGSTSSGTSGSSASGTSGSSTSGSGGSVAPAPAPTLPTLDPIAAKNRAFALNFSAFAPSLGIPKLPPLPSTATIAGGDDAPAIAGEGATPEGTYNPQLPYANATETTKTRSLVADPLGVVTSLDTKQLAKSLAIALILLMAAAHLRRWIGSHVED